jgi:hypothetical protein
MFILCFKENSKPSKKTTKNCCELNRLVGALFWNYGAILYSTAMRQISKTLAINQGIVFEF